MLSRSVEAPVSPERHVVQKGNMKRKIHFNLILFQFFVISIFALASGCSIFNPVKDTRSRAFIDDGSAGWKIKHGKNIYDRETDLLIRDEIKIQISVSRYNKDEAPNLGADSVMGIIVEFIEIGSNFTFSPANATLKLNDEDFILAHGIDCKDRYVHSILDAINERDYLTKTISIDSNDCVFLYFENATHSIDEEFIVDLSNAMFLDGVSLAIPPIHFREVTKNSYRLGFVQ